MSEQIEIKKAAKREMQSKAYKIAQRAFSHSDDIKSVLAKHEGEFRTMIEEFYFDMEEECWMDMDFNTYADHA